MKKDINSYSKEELKKLSDEELKALMDKEREKQFQKAKEFEEEIYPKMSFEEKVNYWSGSLNRAMRWQEESLKNPYTIYTKEWLKSTLQHEPHFEKIMEGVYNMWGGMWDAVKIHKRIEKAKKELENENQ